MNAIEIEQRIALLFNRQPDISGRQINRLHGEQRRMVEELAAEIMAASAYLRSALQDIADAHEDTKPKIMRLRAQAALAVTMEDLANERNAEWEEAESLRKENLSLRRALLDIIEDSTTEAQERTGPWQKGWDASCERHAEIARAVLDMHTVGG